MKKTLCFYFNILSHLFLRFCRRHIRHSPVPLSCPHTLTGSAAQTPCSPHLAGYAPDYIFLQADRPCHIDLMLLQSNRPTTPDPCSHNLTALLHQIHAPII